ncbi:low molecular weight phosphatase family protein [Propionibacteriaceae bacterium Y2011]
MRHHVGSTVDVHSAGTHPGSGLNAESVASLTEVGASVGGEHPKPIDPELLDTVDRVILLGQEVSIDNPGTAPIERWYTDEPSTRGITGMERMRLIRDDITQRIAQLATELRTPASGG